MTARIEGLGFLHEAGVSGGARTRGASETGGFAEALEKMDSTLQNAEQLATDQIAGKPVEVHELVLSQQQALLAMQSAVAVRNTAINAYRELMRATEGG